MAPAGAQSAGAGGMADSGGAASAGAGAGGVSSGGVGAGGASAGAASAGAPAGGSPSGAAGMSTGTGGVSAVAGMSSGAGAPATGGSGGMSSSKNLVTNGTFDGTTTQPWWGYANNTTDAPADQTMAVMNGELCTTMTAGGKNPWDVIVGLSNVVLLPNQYYHISFSVHADAARTIKFKTGFGDTPYTDYFVEPVKVTTDSQVVDYTYFNLRDDMTAQFQFQIGGSGGMVCLDNIVLEPVDPPTMPTYTTAAHSGHPFKYYKDVVKMGTAVDTPIFLSNPLHNAIVSGEFSMITPANSMKMNLIQPTQGVFDFTDTDALVDWATKNGLEFRGHPLVWHTQTPSWLTDGMFDHDALLAIMYAHIDALMGHYVGKFPYWDVVNEAVDQDKTTNAWTYRSTVWHDTIGDDFIDLAFARAHMADPSAKLAYNDYNIEQKGNGKADYVFNMVKDMKSRGVPIDVIGLQSHYFAADDSGSGGGIPNMQAIKDNMARYNDIGIEVHITECDFRIKTPLDDAKTKLQNDFYAGLLQACIDAPNCSHFTVWGLSDLDSWVPSTFPDYDYAHLFDKMLMAKPDYQAMSDVFAQNASMLGMAGGSGMAGGAGSSAVGTAGAPPTGGTGKPAAAPKSDSGGGCSVTTSSDGAGTWLAAALGVLGLVASRRRSKRA